jgi:FkbH-like protein
MADTGNLQAHNETRRAMSESLRRVLPSVPGIAVIHSSLSVLAPPLGLTKWDMLAALDNLVRDGWTIALPAFTFSFCAGKPFDLRSSPSEVGILADWALEAFPGALRTPHPIYSFVVLGQQAAALASRHALTTFGKGSPFEYFERHNATLVMLGCGWKYCTQFHRYEELARVPYRYFKDFSGLAHLGSSEETVTARMYVRDLTIDPQNDFEPAVAVLRERDAIASAELWRSVIEIVPISALAEVAGAQLTEDPLAHVSNAPLIAYRLAKKKALETEPPLRVAVLGHANLEHLKAALGAEFDQLLEDRRVDLYTVPFGQLQQELLEPRSGLAFFAPDISIFADRVEDLLGGASIDGVDPAALDERVDAYGEMILRHSAAFKGWTFVFRFAQDHSSVGAEAQNAPWIIDHLNRLLRDKLVGIAQTVWIDVAGEAGRCPASAHDPRLWFLGRFPFSEPLTKRLARRCAGLALATVGMTARVVVVDLDNTLWGGVLGEDGLEGVEVGGDYPGNAFADFQRTLKQLAKRGIALAIASKNDASLAMTAIDQHPAMELRSGDIVAHRINWQPKWMNIREICDELSLGVESVLFIDDNEVEREAVRRNLPGVKILDLPADPTFYATALSECPWVAAASVTAEDMKRVESYRVRATIEQQRRTAASLDDFYASLDMTLRFQPLAAGNIARAAQLSQKTNQFNTTTRRYDGAALTSIVENDGDVVVIGLQDKFGGSENIGLLVLKAHPKRDGMGFVDNFLLSCRVLGRGLESAILHWALLHARRRRWTALSGVIVETERNTPVRGVFRDAGFLQELPSTEWIKSSEQAPLLPAWLEIDDQMACEQPVSARQSQ